MNSSEFSKKKNIVELTAEEMKEHIQDLERIRKAAAQQNLRDQMLCSKYGNDAKYMRTHKRLRTPNKTEKQSKQQQG